MAKNNVYRKENASLKQAFLPPPKGSGLPCPATLVKSIIHHELIHLNSNDNKLICHRKDWKKYTELANKIYEAYGVNPLITYDDKCFKTKESLPEYNCIGECPRCGAKNYYVLKEGVDYDADTWCHNCGVKYIIKILDK